MITFLREFVIGVLKKHVFMKEILMKIDFLFFIFHMNIYGSNLETLGCRPWPCSISWAIIFLLNKQPYKKLRC